MFHSTHNKLQYCPKNEQQTSSHAYCVRFVICLDINNHHLESNHISSQNVQNYT
jgi:hypothetical protein